VVIGIGNLLRCDDGAGIHLVNTLKETNPDLDAFDLAMGSIDLIEHLMGYERAYIVDAVKTGNKPGTIFKIEFSKGENLPTIHSSHGIDLFTTLRLAEELYGDELPREIIVYGIEAKDIISLKMECTEPVKEALKIVTKKILSELN